MGNGETIELGDGRTLGFDDVGDPAGVPVLFVHGTPDSRRARHPDDGIPARLGVRLVAVDRPGSGLSSAHPSGTVGSFADDVIALADHLGIAAWRTFGWSAGSVYALAAAARHPDRVVRVAVAAGLVPFDAYTTPNILDDADGGRWMTAELGEELGAKGFAEAAAPMLVPYPCDHALAIEHVLESADPLRRTELEAVDGAADAMANGLVDSVSGGLDGVTRDLELQVEPPDVDWDDVSCPVDLVYGERDATAPPSFGRWWATRLRWAELDVVEGAGHLVALTHWEQILRRLASPGR
ncbi:MAG: alpha/beta hydrolase [Acidimicrobiales bacterium]|nr:alpha/beta hydrolase [Acidimicrobiales bacterium]